MADNVHFFVLLTLLMTSDPHEILWVCASRWVLHKSGKLFSCNSQTSKVISQKNTHKNHFSTILKCCFTSFPWSDLKNSGAIRKSVSSLTKSDIFENLCIFSLVNINPRRPRMGRLCHLKMKNQIFIMIAFSDYFQISYSCLKV